MSAPICPGCGLTCEILHKTHPVAFGKATLFFHDASEVDCWEEWKRSMPDYRTLLADTLKVIDAVEWDGEHSRDQCPYCRHLQSEGHAPGCELAALKARIQEVRL